MYSEIENKKRVRPELRCMSIPEAIWRRALELAKENSTSVSALLRQLIKKAYQRNKKKLEAAEVE